MRAARYGFLKIGAFGSRRDFCALSSFEPMDCSMPRVTASISLLLAIPGGERFIGSESAGFVIIRGTRAGCVGRPDARGGAAVAGDPAFTT